MCEGGTSVSRAVDIESVTGKRRGFPKKQQKHSVSSEMRRVGAGVIDDFKDSLSQEELAEVVYNAMAAICTPAKKLRRPAQRDVQTSRI